MNTVKTFASTLLAVFGLLIALAIFITLVFGNYDSGPIPSNWNQLPGSDVQSIDRTYTVVLNKDINTVVKAANDIMRSRDMKNNTEAAAYGRGKATIITLGRFWASPAPAPEGYEMMQDAWLTALSYYLDGVKTIDTDPASAVQSFGMGRELLGRIAEELNGGHI